MTDTIRYIDTDVVGGLGDGTSWENAYSSMASWSAAEATTIADGDRHIANFRGVATDVASAALDLAGDGWGGAGELHIVGDSPDYPTEWDASKYVWKARTTNAPFVTELGTLKLVMRNLQRDLTGNYIAWGIFSSSGALLGDIDQYHCIDNWEGNPYSGMTTLRVSGADAVTSTFNRSNCLILGAIDIDIDCPYSAGGLFNTTNTTIQSVNGSALFDVAASSTVNYTDSAIGGVTSYDGQAPTFTNCATEAGVGTNAVTVTDWDDEFVDAANDDFTLKGTSQLLAAGSTGNNIGVDQITAEANVDPVLDTPQTDITIQTGQTGTIDCAANFSDANAGDTLTYSISPAMSSGFSFNTSTGVITYNGTQAIAAAKSYTVICDDGQGGSPATDTFTITVLTATFIIDSISTATPEAGSTISVTYSNADSTLTASVAAGALNKVSDNGSIAVFDVPVPPLFGDKSINYETAITITFSDGTDTDTSSISIQVPSDELFAQIDTIDADGIYDNDVGVAIGDYAHAKDIVGDVYIDLTDGLTSANPTINSSFNYAIYDVTDGVWEDYAPVSYGAETEKPVITLNGSANLVWVQGVSWVDPGATVTDNVDATRQITSSSAPNVNAVGPYSLPYNATDAAGNVADTVNRLVTVSSADSTPDQFNFVDVANAELSTVYENVQQILGVDAGQTLTATGNLTVSNDGGSTWSSSVQMVTGQTYVKATLTSSATNETAVNSTGAVNGITDAFSVTTKALVTLSYTTPDADAIINQSTGTVLSTTVPFVEAWTAAPENGGSIVDSWTNVTILNGIATFSGSAVSPSTDYLLIFRTAGNVPTGYYRTMGQFA